MLEGPLDLEAQNIDFAQALLLDIARCLVSQPDKANTRTELDGEKVILVLEVDTADLQILRGQNSRTERAFRIIFAAFGVKIGKTLFIDIRELEHSLE